jgi:hypothetical protein
MWAAGLAGDILWLHFGGEHLVVDMRGEPRTVGSHALHVSSSWQWVEAWGDVRADYHFAHAELEFLGAKRPICEAVAADDNGGFQLRFADQSVLCVEAEGNAEEYWRVFAPSREAPHFVVGAHGVEE